MSEVTHTLQKGEGPGPLAKKLSELGDRVFPRDLIRANPGCTWKQGEVIVIPDTGREEL